MTGRWTPEREREQFVAPPSQFVGGTISTMVYLTPSDCRGLRITMAMCSDRKFRIVPEISTIEAEIMKWAEGSVTEEVGVVPRDSFQHSVELFLYHYSQENCVEKVSSTTTTSPPSVL